MIPYFVLFSICLVLAYIVDKNIENNKKYKTLIFIIMFLLSLFAALRNDDIGKDIGSYVIPIFKWASMFNYNQFLKIGNVEWGFKSFIFILSNLFNDYHYILFFIEMFISIFFFSYLVRLKKEKSISFLYSMFIFLFFVYNDSLIMMRQMMSVSVVLLAYNYCEKKKYITSFLLIILAILLHNTAFIALIGYLIIYSDNTGNKKTFIISILFVIFLMIFSFFPNQILQIITTLINSSKINFYLNSTYNSETIVFSKSILLLKFIFCLMGYIYYKYKNALSNKRVFLTFLIIDLLIYIASFRLSPLFRFGYYFSYYAIFYLFSNFHKTFIYSIKNKIIVNSLLILILLFNWTYNYAINGEGGNTVPYKSDIIENIL